MDNLPLILLVFLVAGLAKGVIGLGLPTISIGLLALVMPPAEAASLLLLPSLATNILQCAGPALWPLLRRLWPLLLALLPGTFLGVGLLTEGGPAALGLLGAALVAYAAWGLAAPPLHLSLGMERLGAVPIGLAGGLVTGATGVFVMPVVPWLGALGLARDALVQALGLAFLVATLALGAALAWAGAVTSATSLGSLLALPPALAGMAIGMRLRRRVSALLFRRLFFLSLLGIGAQLAWRGIS